MSKKIGILVGSLREGSFNRIVANKFAELLPAGYEAKFIEIGDVEFFNEDIDTPEKTPASWTRLREEIQSVDGVFFFTPEYNRSVPAALKNALDVGSRPYGQNSWAKKPALVVSISMGAIAGFGANHHLRQTLTFLDMPTLQQPEAYIGSIHELINENGEFNEGTLGFFQTIVDAYLEFFNKLV